MSIHRRPVQQRVEEAKTAKARFLYYAIGLRDDFANLIAVGLDRKGLNQRQLADQAGMKESYISRLANGQTNFKIGVVANVLGHLGMSPVLIERNEYLRLKEIEDRSKKDYAQLAAERAEVEAWRAWFSPLVVWSDAIDKARARTDAARKEAGL